MLTRLNMNCSFECKLKLQTFDSTLNFIELLKIKWKVIFIYNVMFGILN